jgi:hypothetical protein
MARADSRRDRVSQALRRLQTAYNALGPTGPVGIATTEMPRPYIDDGITGFTSNNPTLPPQSRWSWPAS